MQQLFFNYNYLYNGISLHTDIAIDLADFNLDTSENKENLYPLGVAYIRWSDQKQSDKHSLEIQLRYIVSKAKKEGYLSLVLFIDKATSAYHTMVYNRKSATEMIKFIEANETAQALFFYDESRISRSITDINDIYVTIKSFRNGFKFFSSLDETEWDPNDPITQYKVVRAHSESEKKSNTAKSYIKSMLEREKPKRPGSKAPFGYSYSSGTREELVPNDDAKVVVLIFHLYSNGYSDKDIALLLSKSPVLSPNNNEKWEDSSVRYILNNRWYIGDMTWNARTGYHNSKRKRLEQISLFQNHHPALISEEVWEITQSFRKDKSLRGRFNSPFILKGVVKCMKCGRTLATKNATPSGSKKQYNYYSCVNCKYNVDKEDLESKVIGNLSSRWNGSLYNYKEVYNQTITQWAKNLKNRIEKINEDLQTLRYKFSVMEGRYTRIISSAIDKIELEKKEAEMVSLKLQKLPAECFFEEKVMRFSRNINEYSSREKRAFLRLVLNCVTYNNERTGIQVDYRLTPFVEIEDYMNSLSEETEGIV
ncbi:recombinase family protein [Terribacillus goriensis]|uniref:recombinase family protein n=1 Tax=Terribacillus saccharophilus TaxID=361277 RepID=UPI003982E2F6